MTSNFSSRDTIAYKGRRAPQLPRNFVINIVFPWCNNVGNDAETRDGAPFLVCFDIQIVRNLSHRASMVDFFRDKRTESRVRM